MCNSSRLPRKWPAHAAGSNGTPNRISIGIGRKGRTADGRSRPQNRMTMMTLDAIDPGTKQTISRSVSLRLLDDTGMLHPVTFADSKSIQFRQKCILHSKKAFQAGCTLLYPISTCSTHRSVPKASKCASPSPSSSPSSPWRTARPRPEAASATAASSKGITPKMPTTNTTAADSSRNWAKSCQTSEVR